ncbi:hypothetical protein SADUNF_Sadunf13G0099200 [Salix dunnii]|uniref:Uncharacterized protein n=1 Tax=Salix dunnii TaxID=1413687 RepID=A0A835MRH4_9ROSI|nr:hypothetical protein SADUNF_Sadunf13G0099200 [Salix dunnii]
MKTVTGKITESTPVTIAKAASILSKFVSTDNGASQALNAYLRRATAAFDELARLHSKSDRRKHKRDSAPDQRVELVECIRGVESEHAAEQDCSHGIGLAIWGEIRFRILEGACLGYRDLFLQIAGCELDNGWLLVEALFLQNILLCRLLLTIFSSSSSRKLDETCHAGNPYNLPYLSSESFLSGPVTTAWKPSFIYFDGELCCRIDTYRGYRCHDS